MTVTTLQREDPEVLADPLAQHVQEIGCLPIEAGAAITRSRDDGALVTGFETQDGVVVDVGTLVR